MIAEDQLYAIQLAILDGEGPLLSVGQLETLYDFLDDGGCEGHVSVWLSSNDDGYLAVCGVPKTIHRMVSIFSVEWLRLIRSEAIKETQ